MVLIAGKSGSECTKPGAEYGAEQLKSAGFDATLTIINSANHFNVVFHQTHEAYLSAGTRDADFATAYDPGNPVGMQVAQMVLDAIGAGT